MEICHLIIVALVLIIIYCVRIGAHIHIRNRWQTREAEGRKDTDDIGGSAR